MILVGCDLHSRTQQVAVLDTSTGELVEQELAHEGDAVERFYRALPPPVTIGIETTGYTQWFHALMHQLGHRCFCGESEDPGHVVQQDKTDGATPASLACSARPLPTGGSPILAPFSARPDRPPRPVADAYDGQERPAVDRPQPALASLCVCGPTGPHPTKWLPRTRRADA